MSERIPHDQMADEMTKMAWSKRTWLDDFGSGQKKRPHHEIEAKVRQSEVLEQAASDYRAAANRRNAS